MYIYLRVVDRPTQLICISDIYLLLDKYKRHSWATRRNIEHLRLLEAGWRADIIQGQMFGMFKVKGLKSGDLV